MTNLVLNLLTRACAERLHGTLLRSVVAVRGGIVVQADEIGLFFSLLPDTPVFFTTERSFDNDGDQAYLAGTIGAHLAGCRVESLTKNPADRVITLACLSSDGEPRLLHYEAIPRRIDLALCAADDRLLARLRPARSGADRYQAPDPPKASLDLFSSREEEILTAATAAESPEALVRDVRGCDPWFAADLMRRIRLAPAQAGTAIALARAEIFTLAIHSAPGKPSLLLPDFIATEEGWQREEFDDPIIAAQVWFRAALGAHEQAELRAEIVHALARQRKRLQGTLRKLEQDRAANEQHGRMSQNGDLILANIHAIRRGQASVTVPDYYDADAGEREIALDPTLDPAANAEIWYDKARRARRGVEQIAARVKALTAELDEVEALAERAEAAGDDARALRTVQKELVSRRWITQAQKKKLKVQRKPGNRYLSSDGLEIVVGRSSAENEIVTFQIGRENDFWMHAAGSPGSHVVIRNPQKREEPPAATLEQAAALAAWYSKARNNANVQVHWTLRRYVKKLKGGHPGQVLLSTYQSILVKPAIPANVRFIE